MITEILIESKKQYEEKLEKLIQEREEVINKKCEELRETLRNVRNPEIDKLRETIKAFDELIKKEQQEEVKETPIEEVVEEKPIVVEEIANYEAIAEEAPIQEQPVEEEAPVEKPSNETPVEPSMVEEIKSKINIFPKKEIEVEAEPKKSRSGLMGIFNPKRR